MRDAVFRKGSSRVVEVISMVALIGAFVLAYLPVWSRLIRTWAVSDDHSHGFFIVPLALFVLWQKRAALGQSVGPGSLVGLVFVVASLLTYLFASAAEIVTLASLSMIPFLAGAVLFLYGYGVLRQAFFPLALLIFMVPVPAQILAALTIPLQLFVTEVVVTLGSMLGIPLLHQGNLIMHPNRSFEVVQACSGLRSIMTLLTLGVVMGYFTFSHNWPRFVLLLSALPIAIVVNVVRVLAMVAFFHFFGLDMLQGTPHTLLGLFVFVLSLGLFFLVQKGLLRCFR